jgi:hypothetical protein
MYTGKARQDDSPPRSATRLADMAWICFAADHPFDMVHDKDRKFPAVDQSLFDGVPHRLND